MNYFNGNELRTLELIIRTLKIVQIYLENDFFECFFIGIVDRWFDKYSDHACPCRNSRARWLGATATRAGSDSSAAANATTFNHGLNRSASYLIILSVSRDSRRVIFYNKNFWLLSYQKLISLLLYWWTEYKNIFWKLSF